MREDVLPHATVRGRRGLQRRNGRPKSLLQERHCRCLQRRFLQRRFLHLFLQRRFLHLHHLHHWRLQLTRENLRCALVEKERAGVVLTLQHARAAPSTTPWALLSLCWRPGTPPPTAQHSTRHSCEREAQDSHSTPNTPCWPPSPPQTEFASASARTPCRNADGEPLPQHSLARDTSSTTARWACTPPPPTP